MNCVRRFLAMMALALVTLGTSAGFVGCNTIEGAGEDIERGGERIQDAADNE